MRLDQIQVEQVLRGVEPDRLVRVVQVRPQGSQAITLYYEDLNGENPQRKLVYAQDAERMEEVTEGAVNTWTFTGDAAAFRLAAEAWRIQLAHLFDPMMAVHSSQIDPLPHQLTAVYETMLPKQPLRFVLADDPGAGKTIMAGLLIKELMARGDLRRCLIVAPGSLVEQWQDELGEKFGVEFTILTRDLVTASRLGNPLAEHNLLIARLDMLARAEDLRSRLVETSWDLIVVDEAHKMSASAFNKELKKTQRYELGEQLGPLTRHLLLMTATPHNGYDASFQLFLALLDPDRFAVRAGSKPPEIDTSDVLRRMVKEELVRFDGSPLFPERRAEARPYALSAPEQALYEAVTRYVQVEMNRADDLDGRRRGAVGFALTVLQRRLASSPEAIWASLKRRRERMERRLTDLQQSGPSLDATSAGWALSEEELNNLGGDELTSQEREETEELLVDQATAARTADELLREIDTLRALETQADEVRRSGQDCKWDEVSRIFQEEAVMFRPDDSRRKLIVFTEHRDTLRYLEQRIGRLLGAPALVTIHGGVGREQRREAQERFRNDPEVLVLLATDAAGEGVNLQVANLMINYDLPWNPNRLEQRFGRIHRIGQTEVCYLWNLVADQTREGAVYQRLLAKLDAEKAALGGKVFDILGELISERTLRELMIEAIRNGDRPEVRASIQQRIEEAFKPEHLAALLDQHALARETMTPERIFSVRQQMEEAEARRLQPFFLRAFFLQAFERLNGAARLREPLRWELRRVPARLREHRLPAQPRHPIVERYDRVCFEREAIRPHHNDTAAEFLHPGHPLMAAALALTLEDLQPVLDAGTVFVDPNDPDDAPRLLFIIEHTIQEAPGRSGGPRTVSQRLQTIEQRPDAPPSSAGYAPWLDYEALPDADRHLLPALLQQPWLQRDHRAQIEAWATEHLVPEHRDLVFDQRHRQIDKTLHAVHARLTREINHWSARYAQLDAEVQAGKQPRMQPERARRHVDELQHRLRARTAELEAQRNLQVMPPQVRAIALVLPSGLLAQLRGTPGASADADARRRVELLAMRAVMDAERSAGHVPTDVSADKCGWDITSIVPADNPAQRTFRFIEVKGRRHDATDVTLTRNEILTLLNKPDQALLAIVLVDGDATHGPFYVHRPVQREPDIGVTAATYDIKELLRRASPPAP